MARMKRAIPALSFAVSVWSPASWLSTPGRKPRADSGPASEKLDYAAIAHDSRRGLNRSQVMDHISWLSDVYGPRLTGSPTIQQASEWAMKKFTEWGLANAAPGAVRVRQGLVARALRRAT